MDKMVKGNDIRIDKCKRCGDEKQINKFGLCKSCDTEVDYEYSMLYRVKNMEY